MSNKPALAHCFLGNSLVSASGCQLLQLVVCVLVGHVAKLGAEGPSKDIGDLEITGGILMATAPSAALSSGVLLCSLLFFTVSFESHFQYRIKNFSRPYFLCLALPRSIAT